MRTAFKLTLFARLLLAHLVPVALVSIALGLTLLALTRMTGILEEVTAVELHALKQESDVHHAAWLVDISLGHAYSACRTGGSTVRSLEDLQRSTSMLKAKLEQLTDIGLVLRKMAERWLVLAARVNKASSCEYVGSEHFRQERDQLDDELTDLWSQRLVQLHEGVARKDTEARRIGRTALQFGGVIAVTAGLIAMFLSRHLAKALSRPLASLAINARKVGAGDFTTKISVRGPSEVQILAREFERMRAHLAELEQLKQGFLASISHELRTPLSKLREAIALLQDRVVGDITLEQERVLFIAREACEREIRMVSTLLDLSRLRAGSPIRQHTGRSIDEVIRRAVREEQAELDDREVIVLLDLDGPPPACHVDAALVERSIANLVRNALAVSQNGQQVTVRRSWCQEPKFPNFVQITVSDQGPGVPRDIQETVFNPFVTSAVPRSPKALGIGLGLALAREVALAHGGDLILDTSAQKGATFHFLVPHATAHTSGKNVRPRSKMLAGFIPQ